MEGLAHDSVSYLGDSESSVVSKPCRHQLLLPYWNLCFLYFMSLGSLSASEESALLINQLLLTWKSKEDTGTPPHPPSPHQPHTRTNNRHRMWPAHSFHCLMERSVVPLVGIKFSWIYSFVRNIFLSDPVMKYSKVWPWLLKQRAARTLTETFNLFIYGKKKKGNQNSVRWSDLIHTTSQNELVTVMKRESPIPW